MAPAQVAAFSIIFFLAGAAAAGGAWKPEAAFLASLVAAMVLWGIARSAVVILLPLACLAGFHYYHLYFDLRAASVSVPYGEEISFSGIVASEPGHSSKSEYFDLRLSPPYKGKVRIVASPEQDLRYGDALDLKGSIQLPAMESDRPAAFFPQVQRTDIGRGFWPQQALSDLKHKLLSELGRYLPSQEAAFLGGVTLGFKANLEPDLKDALAASGTTHLVALSGYNIAVIVLVVFGGCLRFLGRRAAFYAATVAIGLFVALTGAEASIVRAALMAWVALLAQELGRPYAMWISLLWAAFLMELWDPSSMFTPGFQLSFMSLLGIVYLSPLISDLPWFRTGGSWNFRSLFKENIALTLAAQAAVAPILANTFGGISLLSFAANALILPFMPATMFFGFLMLLSLMIFPPLCALLALACHVLLAYEVAVIKFFGSFPLSLPISLSPPAIAAYYFALALITRRQLSREHEG